MATGPNWEAVIDLYGQGAADVEVARLLNITIGRFHKLCEEVPEFAEMVDRGHTLSQAWWYEQGRTGLFREKFNTALFNFNMKNRHGWADKIDTNDTSDKEAVDRDKVAAELRTALSRISKKHPEILSGVNLKVVGDASGT